MRTFLRSAGYSLVELLVAVGVFGVVIPALFAGYVAIQDSRPQQAERLRAEGLLQEAADALKVIRERGWDQVNTNGTYHLSKVDNTWTLASGPETTDGFTRTIVITDTARTNGAITPTGTTDLSTKKVTIQVSWTAPLPSSVSTTLYLTRYLDNLALVHTTLDDFNLTGSLYTSTEGVLENDGAVILAPLGTGSGDWCAPSFVAQTDLPKSGEVRAISAIEGSVWATSGQNASGVSLAHVAVSNDNPPVLAVNGTFDGYKTMDVFNVGGYAFLGTDANSEEVIIIDRQTYAKIGSFNATGNTNGRGVYASGNRGFVLTSSSLLQVFDASSLTGSRPLLGSVNMGVNGTSVVVIGDYAYVTVASTSQQLRIYNISNPASITLTGSLTLAGAEGRDIYLNPDATRVYMITSASASQREFWLINTANKAAPTVISSYDTNGMDPLGVSMVLSGNRAIIVGNGGEEYQVVSIALETAPTRCGGLNASYSMYDVETVEESDGDAFAYISTSQSSSELKVILGGPGDTYTPSGTYESAPFNGGASTAFNRMSYTATVPNNTTLRLQLGTAAPVSGSCDGVSYAYAGPDGTASTYFTGAATGIPFSTDGTGFENPAQCLRYKAFFTTTDIESTPVLENVTINYSP